MARNAYSDYLNLSELLTLQQPRTGIQDGAVRASEHFFIVVHQSAELLLTQVIDDLRTVLRDCDAHQPDLADAETRLRRACGVVDLICRHVQVLEHLPREHFLAFRDRLGRARAGGSEQFAELFALAGAGGERSLLAVAIDRAVPWGGAQAEQVREALESLGRELRRWQLTHVALVERMIGDEPGTAGSAGAAWLRSRIGPPSAHSSNPSATPSLGVAASPETAA
ncbi:hypothetical protein GCM10010151_07100 [Actinoallomurus spadix]|uniref:Tryptophan 2,3-dioxygenase n=2 Tax=Actinoallomurus spadix TaxID=79912 RepID=A0ABN0VXT2_9ACTN